MQFTNRSRENYSRQLHCNNDVLSLTPTFLCVHIQFKYDLVASYMTQQQRPVVNSDLSGACLSNPFSFDTDHGFEFT